MSTRRVAAEGASFVCKVESTRCPVSDARNAICAVSRSRISPTRITSGSCRRILRSAEANVRSTRSFTCVWFSPCTSYSMGSSTVVMFLVSSLSRCSDPYSVVVFPLPVGPVTSNIPCRREIRCSYSVCISRRNPNCASDTSVRLLSRIRSTAFSPQNVGSVDTRRSIGRSSTTVAKRPS